MIVAFYIQRGTPQHTHIITKANGEYYLGYWACTEERLSQVVGGVDQQPPVWLLRPGVPGGGHSSQGDPVTCLLTSGGVAVGVGEDACLGTVFKVGLRLSTCESLGAPLVGHGSTKPCA